MPSYSRRPCLTELVRSCRSKGSRRRQCENEERTGVYSTVSMTIIHSRKQRCASSERRGHFQRYLSRRQGRAHIQRSVVRRYGSINNVLDSLMQRFLIRGRLMLCPNIAFGFKTGLPARLEPELPLRPIGDSWRMLAASRN